MENTKGKRIERLLKKKRFLIKKKDILYFNKLKVFV